MSAFGTKQTSRHPQTMSAFGGKADMTQCPLFPRKQTSLGAGDMSALCQKETYGTVERNSYSITLSAATSREIGTVRPRDFAALRLRTKSNFVGCTIGRSAGFSPFNIRPT
jgi:hypothetical protein